jgi:hypothetical protein
MSYEAGCSYNPWSFAQGLGWFRFLHVIGVDFEWRCGHFMKLLAFDDI